MTNADKPSKQALLESYHVDIEAGSLDDWNAFRRLAIRELYPLIERGVLTRNDFDEIMEHWVDRSRDQPLSTAA